MDERTIARFWAKVDKSAGPDGCWLWTASKDKYGYGRLSVGGRAGGVRMAHRASWEMARGPVPKGDGYHGVCVCHRCDVRACCNPAHLFLGTAADNSADMVAKSRHVAAPQRGEANGRAKLTVDDVASLRAERSETGISCHKLAAKYGISRAQAYSVVTGKSWAHVGGGR